jgi:hypothetical protein
LIAEGLAKAYLLSGAKPIELQGTPPLDLIEENFKTYFYITKKGTDFHLSDHTWWPFDDDGQPQPNWHLTSGLHQVDSSTILPASAVPTSKSQD